MRSHFFSMALLSVMALLWAWLSHVRAFSPEFFPYFQEFLRSGLHELSSGRALIDLAASLFRWASGFFLAVVIGVPFGLFLHGQKRLLEAIHPFLNLFRSLSPLAWIPFAVIWFGIGDPPVIFLIFLGCVFPLIFTTLSAARSVPKAYELVAREYSFKGSEYLFEILFPAILPQVVSSLRLVSALGWIVLVPAEMLAGQEGLGFAILDARNGMRTDLLVFNMILVALVSHGIDKVMERLNLRSKVRWGHEQ